MKFPTLILLVDLVSVVVLGHDASELRPLSRIPLTLPIASMLTQRVLASLTATHRPRRVVVLDLSLRLGNLIVDRFYGGDLGAWRSRGTSDASFRKLAEHPDLLISASGIYRSVAVYELNERLVGVSGVKQLAVGHYRAVLGLPDPQQVKLLTRASDKGWNVEELREKASEVRAAVGDGRGRKPDPGFVKGIRRLGKLLDEEDGWFDDLDKVDQLDEQEAEALWKTVTGMKIKCEELQKRLASKVPGFGMPD